MTLKIAILSALIPQGYSWYTYSWGGDTTTNFSWEDWGWSAPGYYPTPEPTPSEFNPEDWTLYTTHLC